MLSHAVVAMHTFVLSRNVQFHAQSSVLQCTLSCSGKLLARRVTLMLSQAAVERLAGLMRCFKETVACDRSGHCASQDQHLVTRARASTD